MERFIVIPVNPEPWAVGSLGIGKRNGKFVPRLSPNPQLVSYKEAIKEHLADEEMLPPGKYALEFYFWRRLDQYELESGRKHRRHVADATNMQKATEDALQGVLFDNDRDVQWIHSLIMEQGPDVDPKVAIGVKVIDPDEEEELKANVEFLIADHAIKSRVQTFDNSWPPKDF